MPDPEKQGHMSRIFHWAKLLITSAPLLKGLAVIIITGLGWGTASNPYVQKTIASAFEVEEEAPEPLPIPAGITTVPAAAPAINPEVRQSLASMNAAINAHTGALKAIREDIRQLEERREAGSERDDAALEARIVGLEGFHD